MAASNAICSAGPGRIQDLELPRLTKTKEKHPGLTHGLPPGWPGQKDSKKFINYRGTIAAGAARAHSE